MVPSLVLTFVKENHWWQLVELIEASKSGIIWAWNWNWAKNLKNPWKALVNSVLKIKSPLSPVKNLIYLFQFLIFIALHPTGMYVLAGFSDKLRLMNILIDDIKTFREFPFRNSTSCSFSCGGHLLAAVSHNKISIFSR